MKHLIRFNLLLSLLIVLAACGADADQSDQAGADVPATATEAGLGETATLPPPVVNVEGDGESAPAATEPLPAPVVETEAPAPETATGPVYPWPADRFGYGIQSHATVGDPKVTMEVIADQLDLDWVKVQFEWRLVQPAADQLDWFHYDGVVNDAHDRGLNLMFTVVKAPSWTRSAGNSEGPPDDYNLYADFLGQLVARYQGKVQAIEIWNEQNLDREWQAAAGIVPEDYVDFLSRAYAAIKAQDPNIIVISGALSPTGPGDWVRWADDFEYMDRMLAAGALDHADCVGAHHNGYNIPPDVTFEEAPTIPEAETAFFRGPFENPAHLWSFKTTLDGYVERIRQYDPNMKLCVTEFGWGSNEGYDEYPEGFGFVVDNTLQEQADYIVQAFDQMHDSGDVWLAYLFNFDFGNKGNGPADDPVPYSIVDIFGAPRPAFGAVADMEKRR
jgi:hypothetical protein